MIEDNKASGNKLKKEKDTAAVKKDAADSKCKKVKDVDAVTTATEIFNKRWMDSLKK